MMTNDNLSKVGKECEGICPSLGLEEEVKEEVQDDLAGTRVKGWFVTWPKCGWPKEEVLEHLRSKFKTQGIKEYLICEEQHKNGDPHLHAFIKLGKQKRWCKDMFDLPPMACEERDRPYHANVQTAKSPYHVCNYVQKGGKYISNFDIDKYLKKKGKMVKDDLLRDADDLMDEGILNPMQLASFYKNQMVYKMLLNQKRPMPDELPEKRRHIWICGPSNTGKTTRLRLAMKNYASDGWFQIPTNNDWVGYNNQKYLYMDEFKGQITVQELNRICDGGAKVNIKGGSCQLRWDVEVIICSNYTIDSCYAKVELEILKTLHNRFTEQRLPEDDTKLQQWAQPESDEDSDGSIPDIRDLRDEL